MSTCLPLPPIRVVLSLSTKTRLMWPRSSSTVFSSLKPNSSEITLPAVRVAMSVSISLRRSPNPGALTAQTFSVPRSLLTTSVASASPSTSSAMMSRGLLDCATFSRTGSRSFHGGDLLFVHQHVGVLEHRLHLLRISDEVGRQVAAVELHPVHRLERGLEALRLLDGDHAVLAHLVHGVGDFVADLLVAVRRDRPHLGDLLPTLGGRGDPLQLLHHQLDRLVDAALERHRVGPRGDRLQPFAEDRLRQHRRGGRAVPGDIGGLGRHFLHHLGAHVLDLVLELDLLSDRHTVLGDGRVPELLVDDDVATLRTEGDLHRARELVHAPLEARAGLCIEFEVLGSHLSLPRSTELGDDVGFLDQNNLLLLQLDLRAGVLPIHDPVPDLQLHRDPLALFHPAGPDRDDLTLNRLLLRRVRDVETTFHRLGLFHRPDRYPIGEREDLQLRLRRSSHDVLPPPEVRGRPKPPSRRRPPLVRTDRSAYVASGEPALVVSGDLVKG